MLEPEPLPLPGDVGNLQPGSNSNANADTATPVRERSIKPRLRDDREL
jgi:hypothetical protein